jgi:3-deoxy-D-manno-octulosonate 8-phosphate phosphatase (KDO 8-P phosphatase)
MRVSEVIAGILPKEDVFNYLIKKYKVTKEEICFIGDDLIDIGLMRKVGLPVAVNDASDMVKKAARYITAKGGGDGAVREVVDLVIKAQKLEKKIYNLLIKP